MAIGNHATRASVVGIVLFAFCAASTLAEPAKLYRWVGTDGKVHFSDQIPPEAIDQARQELSAKSGLTVDQVARALTPEERATAAAKAAADAHAAQALEDARQNDQVLLASYPTEADLKHAYDQRIALQAETAKASRIGIESQQDNLSSRLIRASNLELNGKPVDAKLADSIEVAHKQLVAQQLLLQQQLAEGAKMQSEYQSTLEHYRSLQSAAATPSAATPPSVPNG